VYGKYLSAFRTASFFSSRLQVPVFLQEHDLQKDSSGIQRRQVAAGYLLPTSFINSSLSMKKHFAFIQN
jgi:hypothetical protein